MMHTMKKLVLACVLFMLSAVANAQVEFRMITLQHRFANDVLPTVQQMVGPEGSAGAIDNQLWVRATPERLAMIEEIVASLDTARKNMRITISHDDVRQSDSLGGGVSGSGRIGDVRVGVGGVQSYERRDGVRIDLNQRQSNTSSSGSEFVSVVDGERAFIRVGQSVPFTQQWVMFSQRYLSTYQTTDFRDITTGFAVRPRHIGGLVELEITPRIAKLNNMGFIDFEELSTVVRVKPGEWFDLGGNMQSRDDVSRAILSQQQGSESRSSKLMIKVDD